MVETNFNYYQEGQERTSWRGELIRAKEMGLPFVNRLSILLKALARADTVEDVEEIGGVINNQSFDSADFGEALRSLSMTLRHMEDELQRPYRNLQDEIK